MLEAVRARLLRLLRVPPEPAPPFGAPGSIRVFRAGKNFYNVRLFAWLAAQIGAMAGILFSVSFVAGIRSDYNAVQEAKAQRERAAAIAPAQPPPVTPAPATAAVAKSGEKKSALTPLPKDGKTKKNRAAGRTAVMERMPPWVMLLIELAELAGIAGFVLQLPFTFAAVRLDWELRWYIVTDRSLRIRAGIWAMQESTMSFANLQQVEVSQGPFQRLLGIADVRVQSAGGGSGGEHGKGAGESLHTGVFHGVDNASEIRDLILERLRQFRQAGLGDPDDHHAAPIEPPSLGAESTSAAPSDSLAAAHVLLAEARALRAAAER